METLQACLSQTFCRCGTHVCPHQQSVQQDPLIKPGIDSFTAPSLTGMGLMAWHTVTWQHVTEAMKMLYIASLLANHALQAKLPHMLLACVRRQHSLSCIFRRYQLRQSCMFCSRHEQHVVPAGLPTLMPWTRSGTPIRRRHSSCSCRHLADFGLSVLGCTFVPWLY